MKILKFGGSSLAGPEQIKQIVPIVQQARSEGEVLLVVSAMEGVTNQLLRIAEHAEKGIPSWKADWAALVDRHTSTLLQLSQTEQSEKFFEALRKLFAQTLPVLEQIFERRKSAGLFLPDILSIGEKMSAELVAAALQNSGIDARPVYADKLLLTENKRLNADVIFSETAPALRHYFAGLNENSLPVVTGFIGRNSAGKTTLLGRNGSDYTASVLAACLGAKEVEFWTDVDGVLTADPRRIPESKKIEHLSFKEADILAELGTELLHPRTLKPLIRENIPCRIRSTFLPHSAGTAISGTPRTSLFPWKSIAAVSNGIEWFIKTGSRLAGRELLLRLYKNRLKPIAAKIEPSGIRLVLPGQVKLHQWKKVVGKNTVRKLGSHRSVIVIVGYRLHLLSSLTEGISHQLEISDVPVCFVSKDLEHRIGVVLGDEHLQTALNTLHQLLFGEIKLLPLIVAGYSGKVGKSFMSQLPYFQKFILKQYGIWTQVVKLFNSRGSRLYCDAAGQLPEHRIFPPVLADITASAEIAENYPLYLKQGAQIITANKLGLSQPMESYRQLRQTQAQFRAQVKYECTVGAATPFVKALRHIREKGDYLLALEGIFSGTIAFIMAAINTGQSFSTAVKTAWQKGFTEPHPARDLSGKDMQRKLLILLREAGFSLNMEDIRVESLLPADFPDSLPLEAFFEKLTELDNFWEKKMKEAANKGKILTYIAEYDGTAARVGFQEVPPTHPFSQIGPNQNCLRAFTQLHREIPLTISGAGAGAEFTARGLWQDLIQLFDNPNYLSKFNQPKLGALITDGIYQ
ncbi:MAG: bifunctional aspartate kinase/homoserine dehydrogenase I [Calditrichia bacterium]